MKIWIHINGVQEGPYDLSQLPLDRMTPETPVWYEGMTYWEPAYKAILTAELFKGYTPSAAQPQAAEADPQNEVVEVTIEQQGFGGYTNGMPADQRANYNAWRQAVNQQQQQRCPATYIIWSVLLTVLCCNPIGVVPIALGTMVSSKFRNFDIEGAKRTSETTAWWLMVTIVTSLMMLPFSMLMAL